MAQIKLRKDFPEYHKVLEIYLSGDYPKLKKQMIKLDLAKPERSLIESRLLLKDNEIAKAREQLIKIQTAHTFHEAEKELVMANSFGFESNWEQAALHNLKAYELYSKLNDRRGLFITSYNLAVDFSRMQQNKLAKSYYEKSFALAKDKQEQVLILRAMALQLQDERNFFEAKLKIDQAVTLVADISMADQVSTLLIAADLYWQWKDYNKSLILMTKASKANQALDCYRLELEKELTNWCLGKKDKLTFSFGLLGSGEYGLYAKLFSQLQNGDINLAQASWYQLSQKYSERFTPEFLLLQKKEQSTVLGSAVQKWKDQYKAKSKKSNVPMTNTELKLFSLLEQQKTPANKEWLIEQVWQKQFCPSDIAKFYKLVERLRKKQIHILKNSSGYFLK